ncbi:MAG: AraC family transcriptional regulator ligand-binding domain-containing protein, partial [Anderseniella sp.]
HEQPEDTLRSMFKAHIPMVTVSELGALPALVREASGGRALRRLLASLGIPTAVLDTPQARIPMEAMIQLFDAAAREVGDDDFGLRVGRGTGLEDFGDWAAYAAGGRDLGAGIRRLCDTIWVHDTGSRMWLAPKSSHVVWYHTTGLAVDCQLRAYSDHLVKPMLDFVRAFLGDGWEPDWLELDYPKPANCSAYAELITGPVVFGQAYLGVPVRRADLGATSQVADLLPRPVTSVDLMKYRTQRNTKPLEQLIDLIDLGFPDGRPTLDRTARLLGVGPRALQRGLSRNGTQFRTLLELARKRRAAALLLETERPVKAIAGDLGYGEAENFTHAFRSWYGTSPTAFRAADRAPAGT